ncbi:hypothetical protein WK03_11035 [Burkholderia cepacia]|uniref:fimbria/pilus outer membrane usher protein n=1 Tax=Burkholderia cepacia TaxID=292 RepID=UPI00076C1A61|nr:fimbria/pilus outer membrane usher protein [Burkholderia cepacia]KVQ47733.1 hypothetical protein WK03_11035 [Burkholderia cepacia]
MVQGRIAIAGAALAKASAVFANTHAPQSGFDADTLKQLGISQRAADYFNGAPKFMPGESDVQLKVNGHALGLVHARFDETGALCATPALLETAGLDTPAGAATAACYDYRVAYPETTITLRPDENAIDILVPTRALRARAEPAIHSISGGIAALFSYDGIISHSTSNGESSNDALVMSEIGANANDWIVRSRQAVSSSDGHATWTHQSAYVQRTWASLRSTFQGGQIAPASSLMSVGQLYGVQLTPEPALYPQPDSGAVVSGLATGPSRVEVRQLGAPIYVTQVPAGPFQLHGLRLLSGTADLDVTVIGADGRRDAFTVPASSFTNADIGTTQGLSIAVGRYEGSDDTAHPLIATATNGWPIGHRANLRAGILVSSRYQAGAFNLSGLIDSRTRFTFQWSGSASSSASAQTVRRRIFGHQATLSLSSQPWTSLSLSASASLRSRTYRELSDVVYHGDDIEAYSQLQYSMSAAWSSNTVGSFSATYVKSQTSASPASSRAMLTWSRQFGHTSVSVTASTGIGGSSEQRSRAIYLMMTMPFGRRSVSTTANLYGKQLQYGASYSEEVNPTLNYSLSGNQSAAGRDGTVSGTLSVTPRYTQVNTSANLSQNGNMALSFGMHGSAVAYRGGVVFSPYSVGDTFGIVKLDGESGIQLDTPAGPAWTDAWGRALIPTIQPYTTSTVTIDTHGLPRNINIQNGIQSINLARGAVTQLKFVVRKTRRLLLSATLPDGSPVPTGQPVTDAADHFVAVSGDDGHIFLDDVPSATPLSLQMPDGKACRLDFTLTKAQNISRFYESVKAACRPYDPNSTPSPIAPPGAHEDR